MDTEKAANELLTGTSTENLIAEISRRKLTPQHVDILKTLKSESVALGASATEIKQSDMERFANKVIKKNFHGKLSRGSTINDVAIAIYEVGGFFNHGPDQMKLNSFESAFNSLHSRIYSDQNKMSELMQTEFVSVSPSENTPGNQSMTIFLFQDKKQEDSRGWCTPAHASFELSTGDMNELVDTIKNEPDALEAFYKACYKDLDAENEDSPGARRLKTTGFYLVTPGQIKKITKAKESYDASVIAEVFTDLKRYDFKNGPHGSGDSFQPR